MGFFNPKKESTLGSDAIRPCPKCSADEVYVAERGLLSGTYRCDNCGYEPEREEVSRGLLETLKTDSSPESGHSQEGANETANWEEIIAQAESLVDSARGESVNVERLISCDKRKSPNKTTNKPIVSYLFEEEQPHYILELDLIQTEFGTDKSVTVSGPDGTSELQSSGKNPKGWFVITDMRALIIVSGPEEDDIISIPLSSIGQVDYENNPGLITSSYGADVVLSTQSYTYEFSTTDDVRGAPIDYLQQENGQEQSELEEVHYLSNKESVYMCKQCKEEVSPDAKKCPHCGYYPGKGGKGALWHLSSVFVWPMAVKGAADEIRTRKGVAEKSTKPQDTEDSESSEKDPLEKLEQLSDLHEKGVISDEEFETKKAELLDEI